MNTINPGVFHFENRWTWRLKARLWRGQWIIDRVQVCSFRAYITEARTDAEGETVLFIEGFNRWEKPIQFTIKERDLFNARKLKRALCCRNGVGCIILPGQAANAARSIYYYTELINDFIPVIDTVKED